MQQQAANKARRAGRTLWHCQASARAKQNWGLASSILHGAVAKFICCRSQLRQHVCMRYHGLVACAARAGAHVGIAHCNRPRSRHSAQTTSGAPGPRRAPEPRLQRRRRLLQAARRPLRQAGQATQPRQRPWPLMSQPLERCPGHYPALQQVRGCSVASPIYFSVYICAPCSRARNNSNAMKVRVVSAISCMMVAQAAQQSARRRLACCGTATKGR